MKAHRAYLYEIISPVRIEMAHPEGGEHYDGGPLLDRLPVEKEVAFYVDFDRHLDGFVSPSEIVDEFTATARLSTLFYLTATADAVRRALTIDDEAFRFRAFSGVAFRFCSTATFQQDWPGIRDAFRAVSPSHAAIVRDIETATAATSDFLKNAVGRREGETRSPAK